MLLQALYSYEIHAQFSDKLSIASIVSRAAPSLHCITTLLSYEIEKKYKKINIFTLRRKYVLSSVSIVSYKIHSIFNVIASSTLSYGRMPVVSHVEREGIHGTGARVVTGPRRTPREPNGM